MFFILIRTSNLEAENDSYPVKFTDPHQYAVNLPSFVRIFGGKAFEQGSAYSVGDFSGAALWLPPDVHPDDETLVGLIQRTVSNERQEEIFAVLEQMGSYHPSEPHWYLPLIGVNPALHGKGYGSALMEHALIQCDRDQKVAYLESSNPKNITFYERHGFGFARENPGWRITAHPPHVAQTATTTIK